MTDLEVHGNKQIIEVFTIPLDVNDVGPSLITPTIGNEERTRQRDIRTSGQSVEAWAPEYSNEEYPNIHGLWIIIKNIQNLPRWMLSAARSSATVWATSNNLSVNSAFIVWGKKLQS